MDKNLPVRYRFFFVVLIVYAILSVALSWPLARQITTHVPGVAQWAFDESTFLWNVWHVKHTLIDQLRSPLHSDLIWYPLGIDLILYTYNFFHALIAQPLLLAVNLPFASNIALLLSTVLSGFGTFLLVYDLLTRDERRETGDWTSAPVPHLQSLVSAFLAGLVYAFASNRAIYAALGHYDMVTTQWVPFYALMLLRSLDSTLSAQQRRKAALLAGLFFAFNGLAEMITALFLAIFTGIVLVIYLISLAKKTHFRSKESMRVREYESDIGRLSYSHTLILSNLLLTISVAFLLWSPVLWPILRQFWVEDFSLKGWGEAIPLSTDLLGWFTPTILHPFFGGDLVQELLRIKMRAMQIDGSGFRDINTVFLGWLTVVLAIVGAWRYRQQVQIWVWSALLFGLFTLGPFLQINGRYRFDLDGEMATFPLPYALLHFLPIIKANRAPNRNSVLLMLALAVLVGYGVQWISKRLRDWEIRRFTGSRDSNRSISQSLNLLFSTLLASFLLFEHLALPAPLSDARIPSLYAQIAADPRPLTVLQVPLGWRNSFETFGAETTLLQYYQSVHGKPMIGGNISRAPAFKMDYFRSLPFFQALSEIEFGQPLTEEKKMAARAQATEIATLYNIGYVVLYPPIPNRFPYADNWQATWQFVKESLPLEAQPFWAEEGIEAYRLNLPPAKDTVDIQLGIPETLPYRGEGWHTGNEEMIEDRKATWAVGESSRLFFPFGKLDKLDAKRAYQLSLTLRPFVYAGSTAQEVQIVLNGHLLESKTLSDEWQEVTWQLSADVLVDGLNRVELRWGRSSIPRLVLGGNRQIGSTGVELPIDVELNSFDDNAFIALFDEEGIQIDGSAGRSGVNVTLLDRKEGKILAKQGFDTTANRFESDKLTQFLSQIEAGQPVLIASRGDAAAFLSQESIEQLRQLGFDWRLETLRGQHMVGVGVKGTQPASATAILDPTQAFLRISLNRDRRALAAAVERVEIKK